MDWKKEYRYLKQTSPKGDIIVVTEEKMKG